MEDWLKFQISSHVKYRQTNYRIHPFCDLVLQKSAKALQFHEAGDDCRVGKYCNVSLTNKGDPVSLQAVSSIHNEVCLFPSTISADLCRWIAITMVECRTKKEKIENTTSSSA